MSTLPESQQDSSSDQSAGVSNCVEYRSRSAQDAALPISHPRGIVTDTPYSPGAPSRQAKGLH